MDGEETILEDTVLNTHINPSNFPAKLWRLVNSPLYSSVRWDAQGKNIVIDQPMFEAELLYPPVKSLEEASTYFKTSKYTSFIRQLNLYGFRKVLDHDKGSKTDQSKTDQNCPFQFFRNVNFQRDHPELLVNLKRMTSLNKARIAAGLTVKSRPPNRFYRFLTGSFQQSLMQDNQGLVKIGHIYHSLKCENVSPKFSPFSSNQKKLDHSQGLLPNQQELSSMNGTELDYSTYIKTTAHYPSAFYPGAFQYCPSLAHMENLPGYINPTISTCRICDCLQTPPIQSSLSMEYGSTDWLPEETDDLKKEQLNLETVLQFASDLNPSPQIEVVKLDKEEIEKDSSPPNMGDQQSLVYLDSDNSIFCLNQTRKLESFIPFNNAKKKSEDETAVEDQTLHTPECINTVHCAEKARSINPFAFNSTDLKIKHEKTTELTVAIIKKDVLSNAIKREIQNPKQIQDSSFGPSDLNVEKTRTSMLERTTDLKLLADVACKMKPFVEEQLTGD